MKATTGKKSKNRTADLPDSGNDKKHLQPEESIIDLPEVKDIPGQEYIKPMPAGEMADTTISSADEEADDLLDSDEGKVMGNYDSNVTRGERELLSQSSQSMATDDDQQLIQARVDDRDEDGTLLNERTNQSGDELDVPGSDDDDEGEKIGEEDEENTSYSLQGEREDQNNGRQ